MAGGGVYQAPPQPRMTSVERGPTKRRATARSLGPLAGHGLVDLDGQRDAFQAHSLELAEVDIVAFPGQSDDVGQQVSVAGGVSCLASHGEARSQLRNLMDPRTPSQSRQRSPPPRGESSAFR